MRGSMRQKYERTMRGVYPSAGGRILAQGHHPTYAVRQKRGAGGWQPQPPPLPIPLSGELTRFAGGASRGFLR